MVWAGAGFALLDAHGADDEAHGVAPACVEGLGAAGLFPEAVREADGVAEGVELILAFADSLAVFGLVLEAPLERGRGKVGHEGVGVRVDEEAAGLAADDPFEQGTEAGVLFGEREIRPDLRGGIAQPHGGDVAGDDGGVGLALESAGLDGGVESVGEAVGEERGEGWVGDAGLGGEEELLDGFGVEAAVGGWGAVAGGCGWGGLGEGGDGGEGAEEAEGGGVFEEGAAGEGCGGVVGLCVVGHTAEDRTESTYMAAIDRLM